jgi:hypothetical protein
MIANRAASSLASSSDPRSGKYLQSMRKTNFYLLVVGGDTFGKPARWSSTSCG